MKKSILLFIVFCLFSCKDSKQPLESNFSMNLYGRNDNILVKNYLKIKKVPRDCYDSLVVSINERIVQNYNMKVNSEGIFKSCNLEFLKTHSFDTIPVENNRCIEPFYVANSTEIVNMKSYHIDGREYILYHFNERLGGDRAFESYYLKDVGFICYYSFDTDNYLIIDDLIGDTHNYRKLKMEFINDSTFFARHIMSKLFPNYYRVNTSSTTFW